MDFVSGVLLLFTDLAQCRGGRSCIVSGYEQVSVSSGAGRTGCWHEYKSLRKHGINFIAKPIDKLDHRCAGNIFNFNF